MNSREEGLEDERTPDTRNSQKNCVSLECRRMSKDMKTIVGYVNHFSKKTVMKRFQLKYEMLFAWKSYIS